MIYRLNEQKLDATIKKQNNYILNINFYKNLKL